MISTSVNSGKPSLLIVELGLTLVSIAVALCWPRIGSRFFFKAERSFDRLAQKRRLVVLLVGSGACLMRLAFLPIIPIPKPFIHDEFSYLLAADTFSSGRLTNPSHPLWVYFESFHVTLKPTYMSMYFPAQGLIMAVGKVLFGHPWFGVCLSIGIMCSVICWMLQGWLSPGWALLGGVLVVLRIGLFSNWMNGYYGGAMPAIGGALVLGALPRIMRKFLARDFLTMALGVSVLSISRPYEGLLVCFPVGLILCWRLVRKPHPAPAVLAKRAVPAAAVLLFTAGFLGYYDHRVFGNALTLPYKVNRATYAMAPVFLWEPPKPEPVYRSKEMREFYVKWELGDFQYARTLKGFVDRIAQKLGISIFFVLGIALMPPLIMLPWTLRDRRVCLIPAVGIVFALGLSLNAWLFPHYLAPFIGGLYVMLLQCMRHLRVWRPNGSPYGLAIVRVLPVGCLVLCILRLFTGPLNLKVDRWPAMWYGTEPLGLPRAYLQEKLEGYPGAQLAIVKYGPNHAPFDDWVYNAADIDHAKVVWARQLDQISNVELLKYFKGRRVWLVQPDLNPPSVTPYLVHDGLPLTN